MKLIIIYLLVILCFASLSSAIAQGSASTTTTTNPSPATPAYNDTSTIVIDFRNPTLNQVPIDRPFNVLVTNIDTATKNVHLTFYEIETRPKQHPQGPITSNELSKFYILDTILCGGGNVSNGQTVFVPNSNFRPGRNYIFELGNNPTKSSLDLYQQTDLRNYLKSKFIDDPQLKNYIDNIAHTYFSYPDSSFLPLADKSVEIKNYIKKLMFVKYPSYTFDVQKGNDLGYIASAGTSIYFKIQHLSKSSDSNIAKTAYIVKKTLTDYDWVSLIDTNSKNNLEKALENELDIKGIDTSIASNKDLFYTTKRILSAIDTVSRILNTSIDNFVNNSVIEHVTTSLSLSSSYYLDITKNAKTNVTFDIGGGYSTSMAKLFGYYAINVYFRSIDKNLPARNTDYTWHDFLGSRFSLLAGITLTPVDESGVRKGIIGNKGVIAGGSFRLLPWLKVNGGSLMYYGRSTNPLITSYTTRFTPFLSLSIDIDIKPIFSGIPLFSNLLAQ